MSKWTSEEVKFIRKNFIKMTHKEISKHINKSSHAIRNKCWRLNLRKEPPDWEDKEIKLLIKEYSKVGNTGVIDIKHIGKMINRTKYAVCIKANELGLTSTCRGVSEEQKQTISSNMKNYIKENGHPKGMLGKTHTDKVKKQCGKRIREMWEDKNSKMNSKENTIRRRNNMYELRKTLSENQIYSYAKSGYRKDIGLYVKSSWEANYARYLQCLKNKKTINHFEYEHRIFNFSDNEYNIMSYTPDFLVIKDGEEIYHEVKGNHNKRSKQRMEIFYNQYPDVKIKLILPEDYYKINKEYKKIISGWE